MKVAATCAACGATFQKERGAFNRTVARGLRHCCDKACAAAARRIEVPLTEKRAAKAAYDAEYRDRNRESLKAKKAAYHTSTYDPEAARVERARRLPRHREYVREYNARPENRAAKHEYDLARNDAQYGEYAECARLLIELEREVRRLVPDPYERQKARGYFERVNEKKRELRRAA